MNAQFGKVITFYSYKGGVGRSMALANTACLLASWGKKVLIVDFDLEACGIEHFFNNDIVRLSKTRKETLGVIDLIHLNRDKKTADWRENLIKASSPFLRGTDISILSAGKDDENFTLKLQQLDWENLFKEHSLGSYFEELRNQWKAEFDFILLDSRTGITDIGGICTIHLPDIIVFLFTTNETSLFGCINVIKKVKEKRRLLAYDRSSLLTIPLPSRDEARTEYESSQKWKEIFASNLFEFYSDWLPEDVSHRSVIDILRIPYIPYWSFGDRVPVLEEGSIDPNSIGYAYENLAKLIINDLDWDKIVKHDDQLVRDNETNGANKLSKRETALRVFLSSTEVDIREYRHSVAAALLRLGYFPESMEGVGASPRKPVAVCIEKVLNCDVLVVMLAHRYGWVPTIEEGGDGKKSITWIEVEAALANHIPVYAFIVDPKHPWGQPKEQDLIIDTEDVSKHAEIARRAHALKEFKTFLLSTLTVDTFTSPDDLAKKVAVSLAKLSEHVPAQNDEIKKKSRVKKVPFIFRTVHPLQPAPHFKGRAKLLKELKDWYNTPVTPDRVRSLVAIGGTGKTALAERFIQSIKNEPLSGSVFIWSFYDEPDTDAFLREACITFTGEEPEGVAGMLEKLERALAADNHRHLIVLDGLERVQSEGKVGTHQAKGDLEDHRLKNLLRAIAAGLGNTRALITTRFKLTDLATWENAGYKSHELDMLDRDSAIEVLRAWEIKSTEKKLADLAHAMGYHALSVSVLGSYLNHYYSGDIAGAAEFKLEEITADEPQAARLSRILSSYAQNLPDDERDLLVRLSVFPKGVTVDILGYVVGAGGEIAGALIGANQQRLLRIAERLKTQGLIFSYKNNDTVVYTAHPFLRDYFRTFLGVKTENIHEVVKTNLAIGLDTKPENKPTDTATLDRYEQLIEHSILAGHFDEAYELFQNVMGGGGGSFHLFHSLADYGRIIRIISLFSSDGTPYRVAETLTSRKKAILNNVYGLAAMQLGDISTADASFQVSTRSLDVKDSINRASGVNNRAIANIYHGNFVKAKELIETSIAYLKDKDQNDGHVLYTRINIITTLAYTLFLLGETAAAERLFIEATELEGTPLYGHAAAREIEFFIIIGKIDEAHLRLKENYDYCSRNVWPKEVANCHYYFGQLTLPVAIEASNHLQKVRDWAATSGHMEAILKGHILAAEIAYCSGDYPGALSEAETGFNKAEGCGYGKYAIDILLLLAKIHLAIPDYKKALSYARQAFDRSDAPECQYAWGKANGLHLCGVCHKALGEYELARQRLEAALAIREKIQHPEVEETRKLLSELPKAK